jgi:MFS superfamily sulfate permease-like transporter
MQEKTRLARVRFDASDGHFWDSAAIGAFDSIVLNLRRHGVPVEVVELDKTSSTTRNLARSRMAGRPAAKAISLRRQPQITSPQRS